MLLATFSHVPDLNPGSGERQRAVECQYLRPLGHRGRPLVTKVTDGNFLILLEMNSTPRPLLLATVASLRELSHSLKTVA